MLPNIGVTIRETKRKTKAVTARRKGWFALIDPGAACRVDSETAIADAVLIFIQHHPRPVPLPDIGVSGEKSVSCGNRVVGKIFIAAAHKGIHGTTADSLDRFSAYHDSLGVGWALENARVRRVRKQFALADEFRIDGFVRFGHVTLNPSQRVVGGERLDQKAAIVVFVIHPGQAELAEIGLAGGPERFDFGHLQDREQESRQYANSCHDGEKLYKSEARGPR